MKSLRRSLNSTNGTTPQLSPPLSTPAYANPLTRPSEKVAPPQKVIKALQSHRSTNPQELSYTKGDFWYVTGEREGWYEALNPLTGSRGLVPKSEFEEFNKGGRNTPGPTQQPGSTEPTRSQTPSQNHSSQAHSSPQGQSRTPPRSELSPAIQIGPRKPRQPVYAIVQYDFAAERPDELDAKKGEPIVVIAQSNHEWFVAKPIGRLGGPGLIPVAFVEIRDPATGRPIEALPDSIPMVEEWKKATADYKAAAIPLGRFDIPAEHSVSNSPYAAFQQHGSATSPSSLPRSASASSVTQHRNGTSSAALQRPEHDAILPPGEFTVLGVPSFHNESGEYWFRLHITFVPDDPSSPAYTLGLYRTYEDFYDFQISLLDTFPYEAGRPRPGEGEQSSSKRILPYMPGPVEDVIDDELTEYRREELDAYVKALVDLRTWQAGYIVRHELLRTFFASKDGDYCEYRPRQDAVEEMQERLAEIRMAAESPGPSGSVRGYPQDMRSTSASSRHSEKSTAQEYFPIPVRNTTSRGPSPLSPINTNRSGSRPGSAGYSAGAGQSAGGTQYVSGGFPTATTSSSWDAPHAGSVPVPSQPPYVKIKIYDRATDDLIAIRVHPNVTHFELFEKVRARLGAEVNLLRYRTSMTGDGTNGAGQAYREIRDDRELKEWMRKEDQKLVLYAEQ